VRKLPLDDSNMAQPAPPAEVPPIPVGPAVVAPIVTTPPRTYRELYSDASNNPAPDRTARFMAGYRFTDPGGAAGGVPTPATLRDQTVTLSDRQPMAFMALRTGQDGRYEVVIVHRMMRYLDLPGDDESGFNDRVLGLVGDILPHQYPTVEVPGSAFHLIGSAVRVPTVEAMAALLQTWDTSAEPTLGPYTDQAPETEVIRPRNVQVVPGRYAAMLVQRRRMHPKQAYAEIAGEMQARDELDTCQDVLTWLRAACTARGGGGALATVPSVYQTLTPLHLPEEVYQYVTSKVQGDLPALTHPPDRTGLPGADAIAGALQALGATRAAGATGAEGEGSGKEPKTIREAYKETYKTLLRFCNVASAEEVAPLWSRLANCGKGEQHVVLTQELQRVCMSRGLSTDIYVPVVTTALRQMIVGFQFSGHGIDDLTSGCQPFMVAYAGSDNHYESLAMASVSNQLAQGDHNATLSDYRTIRNSEKIKFPRDITEIGITLSRYAVLCQCLFQGTGPQHPFVNAMWTLSMGIQNNAPFISERYHNISRTPAVASLYFARVLRAVQVQVQEYLHQVAINVGVGIVGVELPSFSGLIQELKRGTFHQSTNWMEIPEVHLAPLTASSAYARSTATSSAPGGSVTTNSTARSGVSTLTPADTTASPNLRVENPNRDNEFTSIRIRPGGARNILRAHPPPANDAGNEFCVAWWTRGACFPNCGRRNTHVAFASPGERSRLLTYVREHIQAPAASAASP
jgi:hypothetical protein